MPELLSEDEIEAAREKRFEIEKFDELQAATRWRVVQFDGLADIVRREPLVAHPFHAYLLGDLTYQGALLIAYRALAARHDKSIELMHARGMYGPWREISPRTLDNVRASCVKMAARLAGETLDLTIHVWHLSVAVRPVVVPGAKRRLARGAGGQRSTE